MNIFKPNVSCYFPFQGISPKLEFQVNTEFYEEPLMSIKDSLEGFQDTVSLLILKFKKIYSTLKEFWDVFSHRQQEVSSIYQHSIWHYAMNIWIYIRRAFVATCIICSIAISVGTFNLTRDLKIKYGVKLAKFSNENQLNVEADLWKEAMRTLQSILVDFNCYDLDDFNSSLISSSSLSLFNPLGTVVSAYSCKERTKTQLQK